MNDNLVTCCTFCSELFDNHDKLEKHEDDHKRMGDISVKAIVQSIRNEYNKVITEAKNCKSCQQYENVMCEHHTKPYMNESIWCKIFWHSFPKTPDAVNTIPCNKWDNCDIKSHEINQFHYFCKRCGVKKTIKFDSQGFKI